MKRLFLLCNAYHSNDFSVTVGCGQVERSVIAHVGGVYSSTSLDQQSHQVQVPLLGSPVQWAEPMVVTM